LVSSGFDRAASGQAIRMYRGPSFIGLVYLVVGIVVAANRNYLSGVGDIQDVAEAVLAIILWPLVLLGIDMRF
jgi:hypothetical protein